MSSELRLRWQHAGGTIPADWEIVPFEVLLRDTKGIAVGVMYPGENTLGGIPLIKVGDIKQGAIPTEPSYCISPETNEEYKRSQLQGDELLITLVGSPGECVVVEPHMTGWNPARAIAVVRLGDPNLRVFLKAILESSAGKHLIDAVLNTIVQKTLNLKDIKQLPIPLPDRATVNSISVFSKALTDRISLLRETNATLESIAQALFKSWFIDFDPVRAKMEGRAPEGLDEATAALFPNSFEESELGLVPKRWRVGTTNDLCEIITNGGTPSRSKKEFWDGGKTPWYRTGEFSDGFLLEPSERISDLALQSTAAKLLPEYSVLMAIYAAPTVGRLGILTEPATFNQACTGMRPHKNVGAWFLYWTLYFGRDWFNSRANGAAQQNISKAIVAGYKTIIPPDSVLAKFNDLAGPIHEKIRSNSERAKNLSELRDTLLPRLISGQLRFPEIDSLIDETLI